MKQNKHLNRDEIGPVPINSEFEFIASLYKNEKHRENGDRLNCKDDASLESRSCDFLVSTDAFAEGTHFRLDWANISQIIDKCFTAALSDINACGSRADRLHLTVGLKNTWNQEIQKELAETIRKNVQKYDLSLMGGDTVCAENAFFSLTVSGPVGPKVLTRSDAVPEQGVFVSGKPGLSKLGLELLQSGEFCENRDFFVQKHLNPAFPDGLGALLATKKGIGACIDISDGLSGELNHLSRNSKVRIAIEENKLPIHPLLAEYCENRNLSATNYFLNSGEEFGLLFTMDVREAIFPKSWDQYEIVQIGKVMQGEGVELQKENRQSEAILIDSWTHL